MARLLRYALVLAVLAAGFWMLRDTLRDPNEQETALAHQVARAFGRLDHGLPEDNFLRPEARSYTVRPGRDGLATLVVYGAGSAEERAALTHQARRIAPQVSGLRTLQVEFYQSNPRAPGPDGLPSRQRESFLERNTAWP